MTFEQTIGTRAQVWHGTAKKTNGGLMKSQLMMNKHGRIVSRKKHNTAKRENRLVKAGYFTKKGHFGFIKHKKGSRKMRGGAPSMPASMPSTMPKPPMPPMTKPPMPPMTQNMSKGGKRSHSKRMMRGGMVYGGPLSPHSYDGQGVGTSGAGLQVMATTMN